MQAIEPEERGEDLIEHWKDWIRSCACDPKARRNEPEGNARHLVELRLRASSKLREWLQEFAATPASRAAFGRTAAQGSLAAEIARRQRAN